MLSDSFGSLCLSRYYNTLTFEQIYYGAVHKFTNALYKVFENRLKKVFFGIFLCYIFSQFFCFLFITYRILLTCCLKICLKIKKKFRKNDLVCGAFAFIFRRLQIGKLIETHSKTEEPKKIYTFFKLDTRFPCAGFSNFFFFYLATTSFRLQFFSVVFWYLIE